MQGSESILDHFFKQDYFKIPVYQRNYDWRKDNCQRLVNDLIALSVSKNHGRKHFFGSIIYMIDQDTGDRVVIDGQQRITTIALLLAAIRDSIKEGFASSNDPKLSDKIDRKLKDQDDDSIYLKPVKKDSASYNAIVNHFVDDYNESSNMTRNYRFFKECISGLTDTTLDEFYHSMEKLYVMVIRLNSTEDDAQMVFESINSTGLGLTEGDKIRNFLLMNHSVKDQNLYYENYWCKIDDGSIDLSRFFRDYLTALTSEIPKKDDVYSAFKRYAIGQIDSGIEFQDLMAEIVSYSRYYRTITSNDMDNISTKASILMYHINYQDATVSYPFLLRVLDAYSRGSGMLTAKDVESILAILENYLIRRSICKMPSNALNKVFESLFRMVTKDDGLENFTEKLKWYLLRREGSSAYPRNNEVITCLEELDLYNNHNICPHVLSILENANKDTLDTLVRVGSKDLSIEHVMPQKKSDAWREEIGEQYDDVHQTWLHRLGNLTLTSYNSEYGNKPYSVKRELKDDGFLVSGLRLNAAMKENEHWTEDVISARNKQLVSDFIRFMPEVTSSYAPPAGDVDEPSEFTLEEDDGFFSNVDIKGYSLLGVKHVSKNGVAAFVSLMSDIYQIDPEKMMFLEKEKKPGHLGVWLSSDPDYINEHHGYVSIGHNIWVYKDISHNTKAYIVRKTIADYGIDAKDVAFIGIKDEDPISSENQSDD